MYKYGTSGRETVIIIIEVTIDRVYCINYQQLKLGDLHICFIFPVNTLNIAIIFGTMSRM